MNKITTLKGIYPAKRKDGTFITGNSPKSGKEWKLYNLVDKDDIKFGVFNTQLTDEIKVGAEVFIEYEVVEKNGYKNNNVSKIYAVQKTVNIEENQQTGTKPQGEGKDALEARLSALEARIEALEKGGTALGIPEYRNGQIDIKAEDLPF